MAAPDLPGKLVALSRRLSEAAIPHAFGGAIALAAYTEPRGTDDLDVGVFAASDKAERVVEVLGDLGCDTEVDVDEIAAGDWGRLFWDETPIDVFFAYSELHFESESRVRHMTVRGYDVPVLAPEDLVAHKIVFNRDHDWIDVENVIRDQPGLDLGIVRRWVVGIYDDRSARQRLVRLNDIAERHGIAGVELPARAGFIERLRTRLGVSAAGKGRSGSGGADQGEGHRSGPTALARARDAVQCRGGNVDGSRCTRKLLPGSTCPAHNWTAPR